MNDKLGITAVIILLLSSCMTPAYLIKEGFVLADFWLFVLGVIIFSCVLIGITYLWSG